MYVSSVGRGSGERLAAGWATPRSEDPAGDQADPTEPQLSVLPPSDSDPVCEPLEVDHRSELSWSEPTQAGVWIPRLGLAGCSRPLQLPAAGVSWPLLVAAAATLCWLLAAAVAGRPAFARGSTLPPEIAGWPAVAVLSTATGRPVEVVGGTSLRYICRAKEGPSCSSRRGRRDLVQSRWQSLVSLRTSSLQVEAPPLARRT